MLEQHNETDGLPVWTYLSWSRLSGYLDPGGNNGFSSVVLVLAAIGSDLEGLDEFPALPDFTMPLFGGITVRRQAKERFGVGAHNAQPSRIG